MLQYKFRSLQNIEFALDIIINERLHCASYNELNDPFEGLFHTILYPSSSPPLLIPIKEAKRTISIGDLHNINLEHSKICSLSKSLNEIRLWAHYADGHKGVAIEIDFSGNEKDIYEVKYVPKLQEFGHTLLTSPSPAKVLSFKTEHWKYEDEYRIIQKENYYPITGRIKTIFTGHRMSKFHLQLLEKVTPSQILIIPTEINTKKIIVQPIKNENSK